jgi:hypothetical protein
MLNFGVKNPKKNLDLEFGPRVKIFGFFDFGFSIKIQPKNPCFWGGI